MSASWDGIPDPASKSFVVGSIDGPWRGSTLMSLAEARRARRGVIGPAECVFAWVDGRHVRVPDGDPPKPAPVITVDGVEVAVRYWEIRNVRSSRIYQIFHVDDRDNADRILTGLNGVGLGPEGPYFLVAVIPWPAVLLPEEGT